MGTADGPESPASRIPGPGKGRQGRCATIERFC
jgi:hypothetical protein